MKFETDIFDPEAEVSKSVFFDYWTAAELEVNGWYSDPLDSGCKIEDVIILLFGEESDRVILTEALT